MNDFILVAIKLLIGFFSLIMVINIVASKLGTKVIDESEFIKILEK